MSIESASLEPSLLEGVARGHTRAVERLLDRYGALIWSIARRQLDPQVAEDVVQEIFIDLWKSADRYDAARASEATFITMIARRRIIDHRRKAGRRPPSEVLYEEKMAVRPDVNTVELAEEVRIASEAIASLKPNQQRVLKLALVEGMSHSQIAEATGLPLGTVKTHARRGLERVRDMLTSGRRPGRTQ